MKRGLDFLLLPQIGLGLFGLMGLVLLVWPAVLTTVFPPLVGVVLMLIGAQGVATYFAARKTGRQTMPFKLVQNLLTFGVGVVFIVKNDVSSAFLAILFGLFVVVTSVLGLCDAVRSKASRSERFSDIGQNLVGLVWGILLFWAPFSGRALWAQALGGYFIVIALMGIVKIQVMKKELAKKLESMMPPGFDDDAA